jgi:hypothetical protein
MFEPSDLIHSYTRAQAIEDGSLVDVSDVAMEAGYTLPVAITRAAWARYVEVANGIDATAQLVKGRLWDILYMLNLSIRLQQGNGPEFRFQLFIAMPDETDWQANECPPSTESGLTRSTHRLVMLKALCGPDDNMEPVITIMLPHED